MRHQGHPSDTDRLSVTLKQATQEDHVAAEDSPFMRDLVAGRSNGQAYAALATQLWFVYRTLEAAAEVLRHDDRLRPLLAVELTRAPSLEADLVSLCGSAWRTRAVPSLPTIRYTEQVADVARHAPHAFVAHHYTRYLGDLSGGQVLRHALRRHYGLADHCLTFFDFRGIPKVKVFRDDYRRHLDDLGDHLDPAERALVLAEARAAFRHNRAVFDALVTADPRLL